MKIKEFVLPFVWGFVVPLAFLGAAIHFQDTQPEEATQPTQLPDILTPQQVLTVLTEDGNVEQMVVDDYLTGVVLGEMPADFHPEALKAQAVVARTYAMKRAAGAGKHQQADVCTDPACCQCFLTVEDYLADGGTQASVDKIAQAVADTSGLVVTYDGELIDATYFSCSGGSTEAAVAVWGSDVPYLQAVESPGEENAAHYTDQVSFTPEEFAQKVGFECSGTPSDWFGAVTYTDGGGVDAMQIRGQIYEGTQLRSLLGLRSTAFDLAVSGNAIVITTRGYGHRVGMSQYGAQAMAEAGSSFEEILTYYYQGTILETIGS